MTGLFPQHDHFTSFCEAVLMHIRWRSASSIDPSAEFWRTHYVHAMDSISPTCRMLHCDVHSRPLEAPRRSPSHRILDIQGAPDTEAVPPTEVIRGVEVRPFMSRSPRVRQALHYSYIVLYKTHPHTPGRCGGAPHSR